MPRGARGKATCSRCDSGNLSSSQRRKGATVRRCIACVALPRCSHRAPCFPLPAHDGDEEPADIHVDICGPNGAAEQSLTEYGRSVHFDNGTAYTILIQSTNKRRVAANLTVDGRKVNTTPVLIGVGRTIKGFSKSRSTLESVKDDGRHHYSISTQIEPFRAVAPPTTGHDNATGAPQTEFIDNKIGTIEIKFFGVKMVRLQPGTRTRRHLAHEHNGHSGRTMRGRNGVMVTRSGPPFTEVGTHIGSDRKPVIDKKRFWGQYTVTICSKRVARLGDWIRQI
jgi:hypothetical protein